MPLLDVGAAWGPLDHDRTVGAPFEQAGLGVGRDRLERDAALTVAEPLGGRGANAVAVFLHRGARGEAAAGIVRAEQAKVLEGAVLQRSTVGQFHVLGREADVGHLGRQL